MHVTRPQITVYECRLLRWNKFFEPKKQPFKCLHMGGFEQIGIARDAYLISQTIDDEEFLKIVTEIIALHQTAHVIGMIEPE